MKVGDDEVMETCVGGGKRRRTRARMGSWIKFALLGVLLPLFIPGAVSNTQPTESECREFIEKALKEQHQEDAEITVETTEGRDFIGQQEESHMNDNLKDPRETFEPDDEKNSGRQQDADDHDDLKNDQDDDDGDDDDDDDGDGETDEDDESMENDAREVDSGEEAEVKNEKQEMKDQNDDESTEGQNDDGDDDNDETKDTNDNKVSEERRNEEDDDDDDDSLERPIEVEIHEIEMDDDDDEAEVEQEEEEKVEESEEEKETETVVDDDDDDKKDEDEKSEEKTESEESKEEKEEEKKNIKEEKKSVKEKEKTSVKEEKKFVKEESKKSVVEEETATKHEGRKKEKTEEKGDEKKKSGKEKEDAGRGDDKDDDDDDDDDDAGKSKERKDEKPFKRVDKKVPKLAVKKEIEQSKSEEIEEEKAAPEEELTREGIIPDNLRSRTHIEKILRLDEDSGLEKLLEKTIDSTLKTLKKLYEKAIKPLEILYKYRDLSNRHFGDPEIFSKPLILFMGPWSGGKSTTINYLINNEFTETSLRTGAEPSPAYFNILMHGEEEEILDGTQLAADWTFSGLQKFGQGLLDRLKGVKLPNKLLEKVNIVEIPGILEIRKQVQRIFPFNDACQWFIDRADIIFLVYDPSKLDVGPETEAILDQLKGRESQTRIILNKADRVKPEELMRVQGTLIWNISPLMSSSEPPIMYSTSLWSMPYETGAPTRLLSAQERAFLKDLREAIDKRVENKISSARRFAVRVRNHAKMVDCYLTTYYNHKSFFGNRKRISDDIIENPQKYHIYEGLSTLTNISRYDLPDPEAYRDFFKLNPLYDFQKLSETCTYFRGCPINKLDVVIAYDLPELVGKYRKAADAAREQLKKENS